MIPTSNRALAAAALLILSPLAQAEHVYIPKFGSTELIHENQIIFGNAVEFDSRSSLATGFEIQRKLKDYFSLGPEILIYQHDYDVAGSYGGSDTFAFFFNVKGHLPITEWFQPYLGGGIGATANWMDGPIDDTSSEAAYQLNGGVEFLIDKIGIIAEYKYINAEPSEKADDEPDTSSRSVFFGISIHN